MLTLIIFTTLLRQGGVGKELHILRWGSQCFYFIFFLALGRYGKERRKPNSFRNFYKLSLQQTKPPSELSGGIHRVASSSGRSSVIKINSLNYYYKCKCYGVLSLRCKRANETSARFRGVPQPFVFDTTTLFATGKGELTSRWRSECIHFSG